MFLSLSLFFFFFNHLPHLFLFNEYAVMVASIADVHDSLALSRSVCISLFSLSFFFAQDAEDGNVQMEEHNYKRDSDDDYT